MVLAKISFSFAGGNVPKYPIDINIQIVADKRKINNITKKIGKKIFDQFYKHVNFRNMQDEIQGFFIKKFKNTPEYISLTSGTLRGEFGLDDRMVADLPQLLRDLTNVDILVDPKGELSIYIGFASLDELDELTNKYSYFSNGNPIDWLWWLLFMGTKTIIVGYKVAFGADRGRSGLAIMVGKKDGSSSYTYSVGKLNAHFAGTAEDNWFNRTLREHSSEFLSLVKKHLDSKV